GAGALGDGIAERHQHLLGCGSLDLDATRDARGVGASGPRPDRLGGMISRGRDLEIGDVAARGRLTRIEDGDCELLESANLEVDRIADECRAPGNDSATLAAEGDRMVHAALGDPIRRGERDMHVAELQRLEADLVGEPDAHALAGSLEAHDLADRLMAEGAHLIATPHRGRRQGWRIPCGCPVIRRRRHCGRGSDNTRAHERGHEEREGEGQPVRRRAAELVGFHQLRLQGMTVWRCSPRLPIPSRMVSPAARNTTSGFWPMPTPGGVPVVMMSPGSSVMKWLT